MGNCGDCTQAVVIIGTIGTVSWFIWSPNPESQKIVAGAVLGALVLLGLIGKGRAVQKGQPIWWVCTPVYGCCTVAAFLFVLPFAIKTYCTALCNLCKKKAATSGHTQAQAHAQALAAAYAAGKADAERIAAEELTLKLQRMTAGSAERLAASAGRIAASARWADATKQAQPEEEPVIVVESGGSAERRMSEEPEEPPALIVGKEHVEEFQKVWARYDPKGTYFVSTSCDRRCVAGD